MAFLKTITYKGITVENAYIKAENFSGDKNGLTCYMRAYKDQSLSNDINNILTSTEISFTPSTEPNSDRWDKQAYEYAKTLPEFIGAIDVLED